MGGAVRPPRRDRDAEPQPPLRALLDLTLEQRFSERLGSRIDHLGARIGELEPESDWLPIYTEAVTLADDVAAELDQQVIALQERSVTTDDPNEIKRRSGAESRRTVEKLLGDVKAGVKKVTTEWTGRCKRQAAHVLGECVESAKKDTPLVGTEIKDKLEVGVDPAWWPKYADYVTQCCEQWTLRVTSGFEARAVVTVADASRPLLKSVKAPPITPPPTTEPPAGKHKLGERNLPTKTVDLPGVGASLMQFIRSNIIAIGMFGGMLVAAGTMLGLSSDKPGNMRGYLMLGALGPLLLIGFLGARKNRRRLAEKAHQDAGKEVERSLAALVKTTIERHGGVLERWVAARAEAWDTRISGWFEQHSEAYLKRKESDGASRAASAKLEQARLSDELNTKRSFRNKLNQGMVLDLKRRHRELKQAAERAAEG